MELMDWKKEYSVNVTQFDDQHKELLQISNELQKAVLHSDNNELVSKYLNELVTKAIYHFAVEEKVMKETKYPGYAKHKEIHKRLTLQFINATEFYKKNKILKPDFLDFVRDWLLVHITEGDKRYTRYLNEAGVE